jgi:hypothetical protein
VRMSSIFRGSARVPACNFRRPAGKTVFGETPNTTRETRMLPNFTFNSNYQRRPALENEISNARP